MDGTRAGGTSVGGDEVFVLVELLLGDGTSVEGVCSAVELPLCALLESSFVALVCPLLSIGSCGDGSGGS